MGVELPAVNNYFKTKLSTDSQLSTMSLTGYFSDAAPNDQTSPYILWSYYGGMDVVTVEGNRINTQVVYLVRVVGRGHDFSSLRLIADRIDVVLNRSTGTAYGHTIDACVREAPYSFVENKGDVQWRHLGGRFRLWVSA